MNPYENTTHSLFTSVSTFYIETYVAIKITMCIHKFKTYISASNNRKSVVLW